MKPKTIKAKLLRFLGITKPIQLSKEEIKWIKLCKLHYKDDVRYKGLRGGWIDFLKPLFIEIYTWDPDTDNNYKDFLDCMFNKLLDIHLKILLNKSGSNVQLKGIFKSAFHKSILDQQELPIERAISELCGLIQGNIVIENGVNRYYLQNQTL